MNRRPGQYRYRSQRDPIALPIRAGAVLAVAGAAVLFAGPLGYRLGLLSLPVAADRVFVWGGSLGGVAAVLALIGGAATFARRHDARRGLGRAVLAVLVGGLCFRAAGRLPFVAPAPSLQDVTTDTVHPPEFVTLPQVNGAAARTYPGEAFAAAQRRAYPDIQTLDLALDKDAAFTKALSAIRGMGWRLVAADGAAGRIEASARTRLFGTTEDVVVRLSAAETGTRVDVRSVSRDEPGDGRSNASRVRAVLRALASS